MTFFVFLLFILLFRFEAHSGETYGVLLSGGYNVENNHYRYYNNTQEMYLALRSAGLKRDNITTLYADGMAGGANTTKMDEISDGRDPSALFLTEKRKVVLSTVAPSLSLEGDGKKDIKYPATPSGIGRTFDELAGKMKSGDKLVVFITDHGNRANGVVLWNGEYYSVSDFQKQLEKLPNGVKVQIATNICYGGQLLRLTSQNVCVVANSNDSIATTSNANNDPFASGMAKSIKASVNKTNGRPTFLQAFEAGKSGDLPDNKIHLTSIDYFIERQSFSSNIFSQEENSCSGRQSPILTMRKEIAEITNFLSKVSDPRKVYYEKYLKKKLNDISEGLNTYKNQYSNWVRDGYQQRLDKLKAKWSSLTDIDKQRLRPYYTELAENLRESDNSQRKKIDDLEEDSKRALLEMRFLKNASPSQLQQYYDIRKCLEDEI